MSLLWVLSALVSFPASTARLFVSRLVTMARRRCRDGTPSVMLVEITHLRSLSPAQPILPMVILARISITRACVDKRQMGCPIAQAGWDKGGGP